MRRQNDEVRGCMLDHEAFTATVDDHNGAITDLPFTDADAMAGGRGAERFGNRRDIPRRRDGRRRP